MFVWRVLSGMLVDPKFAKKKYYDQYKSEAAFYQPRIPYSSNWRIAVRSGDRSSSTPDPVKFFGLLMLATYSREDWLNAKVNQSDKFVALGPWLASQFHKDTFWSDYVSLLFKHEWWEYELAYVFHDLGHRLYSTGESNLDTQTYDNIR